MTESFEIAVDHLDRAAWEAAADRAHAPLQQRWAYGEAMAALGAAPARLSATTPGSTDPCAVAQFLTRRVFGRRRLALASRGPVWTRAASDAERTALLKALPAAVPLAWPQIAILGPGPADGRAVDAAGLTRLASPATVATLDLTPEPDALRRAMRGKWRNRLRTAERAELAARIAQPDLGDAAWAGVTRLLQQDRAQQKARGFAGLPTAFVPAFADAAGPGSVWLVSVGAVDAPAAEMLFLRHGATATYHVGWTSEDGRRSGAHGLALWRVMTALRGAGVRRLDLGVIDTAEGAGRARFKLGAGARPERLAPACA